MQTIGDMKPETSDHKEKKTHLPGSYLSSGFWIVEEGSDELLLSPELRSFFATNGENKARITFHEFASRFRSFDDENLEEKLHYHLSSQQPFIIHLVDEKQILPGESLIFKGEYFPEKKFYSGSLQDINGILDREKLNVEGTKLIAELASNIDIPMLLLREGIITNCNGGALSLFDTTQTQILGLDLLSLFPEQQEDGIQTSELLEDILSGENQPQEKFGELICQKFTGELIKVKISIQQFRFFNQNFQIILLNTMSDTIEPLQKLRESEERYRSLFERAPVGIVTTTIDGRLISYNPAVRKMLAFPSFNKRMEDVRVLYADPEDREKILQQLMAAGKVEHTRVWFKRFDGSKFLAQVNLSIIKANGKDLLLGILQDVTKRYEAEKRAREHEAQLLHADRMVSLGTLVSGVAHEINNPNNYISLNAKLLQEAWEDILPVLTEYYTLNDDFILAGLPFSEMKATIPNLNNAILKGSDRIKQIIKNLKDFSRQGSTNLNDSVDLNEVVNSALSLTKNLILRTTSNFHVQLAEHIPQITGNFQQLEQVVINLIQNACQALKTANARIEVSVEYLKQQGFIRLMVEDEGCGIPEENFKYILDPFFTTKRDSGGTGLGLSVSKGIVENHSGELTFESDYGTGTKAIVLFPVGNDKEETVH